MSAIYGNVQWRAISAGTVVKQMEEPLHKYRIDQFSTETYGGAEFGCGLQYFTQESERENLPVKDEKEQILMTADVVLDNREELMQQFGITKPGVPDGRLVYLAYTKWGEEFVKLLRGVFAIAIYDRKKERLLLYTDHMGSRALNYYCSQDGVVFASTFAPILEACPEIGLCEQWIAACEAVQSPDMELFPELTPYEGVLHLEAGKYLCVTPHGIEKKVYWDPLAERETMPFEDAGCRKLFVDTFRQCVKDVLRSKAKTAAMVSSGLDSTSVASVAAEYLGKEGKKLYTYTSIPEGEFEAEDYFAIANEAWGPEELKKKYRNIDSTLVPCDGMNGFTKLERLVQELEVPTKSAPNMMWIDEIYQQAREKGCKIILKGQYGNATISYGKILSNIRYQLSHGHFIRAFKEAKAFGTKNEVPAKKIYRAYRTELKASKEKVNFVEASYLAQELLDKYQINYYANIETKRTGGGMIDSEEQARCFRYDQVNLAQLGMYDTHFSLLHGILVRDPTKDKRMVELCLRLPVECLVHNGVERRLVREYMQGIVPDTILSQVKRRGQQSADYVERVCRAWDAIEEEVIQRLEQVKDCPYMDTGRMESLISKLRQMDNLDSMELSGIVASTFNFYAFSVFLEMQEQEV